jgi:ketosteroid isomerase-like protein
MSRENMELVRSAFDTFLRGDDSFFEQFHPEVEWMTAQDEPDQQTYRGIEGVKRLLSMLFDELWDRDGFEILSIEFIEAGEFVVVPIRARVKARQSGVELEADETYVYELAEGKVVRVREYRTKQEALEAVGLAE